MTGYCECCERLLIPKISKSGRKERNAEFERRKFCGKKCARKYLRGENHPSFIKGGTPRKDDGYYRTTVKGERVYVHRYNMEAHLGRKLEWWEEVHHIDEDKSNNDIINLEIKDNRSHAKYHAEKRPRTEDGKFAQPDTDMSNPF